MLTVLFLGPLVLALGILLAALVLAILGGILWALVAGCTEMVRGLLAVCDGLVRLYARYDSLVWVTLLAVFVVVFAVFHH